MGGGDEQWRRMDRWALWILAWSWGLLSACANMPQGAGQPAAREEASQGARREPREGAPPEPKPAVGGSSTRQAPESLAPAQIWTIELEGVSPALVYTPPGNAALPLWFAAHGAGGTAQQQIEYWSRVLGDQYVIVALAGVPLSKAYPDQGHYYPDHLALGRELDAVLQRLRTPEGQLALLARRFSPAPYCFGAYSQGATMGALVLVERPELFQRLVLIEGGYEGWTKTRALKYKAGGGQKVLWVCGTRSCWQRAQGVADVARQVGLAAQAERVQGGGHAYWGPVETRVTERLSWLLMP